MQDGAIGRRYARALSLALEGADQATLQQVEAELSAVAALLSEKRGDLREAMLNPSFGANDRKAILEKVADAHNFQVGTRTLLLLLVDKDRIRSLPAVAESFRDEVDARTGRVRAHIATARPLDEGALKALVSALERKVGKAVIPEVEVAPEVISGVQARIGGLVFDATVRSQLNRLQSEFMQ